VCYTNKYINNKKTVLPPVIIPMYTHADNKSKPAETVPGNSTGMFPT